MPDFNVLVHHALARGLREPIPGARLHEGINKQVAEFSRRQPQARPLLVGVLVVAHVGRALGHGEQRIGSGQILAETGREQRGRHLLELRQVIPDPP